jgi:hypothetical protein
MANIPYSKVLKESAKNAIFTQRYFPGARSSVIGAYGSGPERCFVALGLVPDGEHSVLKGTQRECKKCYFPGARSSVIGEDLAKIRTEEYRGNGGWVGRDHGCQEEEEEHTVGIERVRVVHHACDYAIEQNS